MHRYSLLLYECGLQTGIPHLDDVPSWDFPFWADHVFLDFLLRSLSSPDLSRSLISLGYLAELGFRDFTNHRSRISNTPTHAVTYIRCSRRPHNERFNPVRICSGDSALEVS